jgi:outer membrane protein assembly factor BamD
MLKNSRAAIVLFAVVPALALSACATGGKTKGDTAYVARDVSSLYGAAQRAMNTGDYDTAAGLFDEVERQHPYSEWARRAQLMSAFNYYLAQKYPKAVSSAQRFLTIHPGNADAPYAQYLVAMSYYQQIADVTRDQSITQQASDAFGELIRRYPDTRYAADARLKMDLVRDHLAGKEMEVGRFYERRNQWLAAVTRFRSVIEEYQTTSHTPEALMRLTECYLALGVPEEARRSAAVLGANYPGTKWYQRAYDLVQRHPVSAVTPASAPAPAAPAPAAAPKTGS